MARRRMLDPEFFFDEELAQAKNSAYLRLFYQGLWCHCDDIYHTVPYRIGWLKAQIFPYEEVNVEELWKELEFLKKITLFTGEDGLEYGWLKNFSKYQRIDKPSSSKYQRFPGAPILLQEDSGSTPAKEKRSKVKISEVSKYPSITFLTEIPESDLKELRDKYEASAAQIKRKAEELKNYCDAKGKKYKNYRAFLENALSRDFGRRLQTSPIEKEEKRPLTAEVLAARDRVSSQIRELGIAKRVKTEI